MSVNISFNAIKNQAKAVYALALNKANEWLGHTITVLKSGRETALPYLQDKRIAVVSLVIVNLMIIGANSLFGRWIENLPNYPGIKGIIIDLSVIASHFAITAAGVWGFSKYARLPLSPLAIVAISAITISITVAAFSKEPR